MRALGRENLYLMGANLGASLTYSEMLSKSRWEMGEEHSTGENHRGEGMEVEKMWRAWGLGYLYLYCVIQGCSACNGK